MHPTQAQWLKLLALPLTQSASAAGARAAAAPPPPFLLHALKGSLASASAQSGQPTHRKLLNKSIDKAADLWAGLGKAKDGSMKRKIYVSRASPPSFPDRSLAATFDSHLPFCRLLESA
jgi:hypothetical protein